jgi:hypothetical protein
MKLRHQFSVKDCYCDNDFIAGPGFNGRITEAVKVLENRKDISPGSVREVADDLLTLTTVARMQNGKPVGKGGKDGGDIRKSLLNAGIDVPVAVTETRHNNDVCPCKKYAAGSTVMPVTTETAPAVSPPRNWRAKRPKSRILSLLQIEVDLSTLEPFKTAWCWLCDKDILKDEKWVWAHVYHKARRGDNGLVLPAHRECNDKHGTRPLMERPGKGTDADDDRSRSRGSRSIRNQTPGTNAGR